MTRKLLIGSWLFVGTCALYLLVSRAEMKVHVATIVPWFIVTLLGGLAVWAPWRSRRARAGALCLIVLAGGGLHLYANTAFFGKMEPSVGSYLAFVLFTAIVLGIFVGLTVGLARLVTRWWP